jgi:hypothetical protein
MHAPSGLWEVQAQTLDARRVSGFGFERVNRRAADRAALLVRLEKYGLSSERL